MENPKIKEEKHCFIVKEGEIKEVKIEDKLMKDVEVFLNNYFINTYKNIEKDKQDTIDFYKGKGYSDEDLQVIIRVEIHYYTEPLCCDIFVIMMIKNQHTSKTFVYAKRIYMIDEDYTNIENENNLKFCNSIDIFME
jgi:hypothetical protein